MSQMLPNHDSKKSNQNSPLSQNGSNGIGKRFFLWERRRRVQRPKTLIFLGTSYVFFPFFHYLYGAHKNGLSPYDYLNIFNSMHWLEISLSLSALPIGLGLLLVQKWGWYLFLALTPIHVFYNIYVFLMQSSIFNFSVALVSFSATLAFVYFTSKDISAPYFKMYPRGWRYQLRRPIRLAVQIDQKTKRTTDCSNSGFYVKWIKHPFKHGDSVGVKLVINKERFSLKAGVVRIDDNGLGFAFRDVDPYTQAKLHRSLQQKEQQSKIYFH